MKIVRKNPDLKGSKFREGKKETGPNNFKHDSPKGRYKCRLKEAFYIVALNLLVWTLKQ